jgi:hypothetical protein
MSTGTRRSLSSLSIVVARSEQVSAHLDSEVVILGFRSGSYYGLDQVGLFVWELLQEPRKVSDIRDAILAEYDVPFAQCEDDLLRLLKEMAAKQLIEVQNAPLDLTHGTSGAGLSPL